MVYEITGIGYWQDCELLKCETMRFITKVKVAAV
jgi:hypothetical protein